MQKTTFPFEIIIHDDASTDKTSEILREYKVQYPNIIKCFFQTENQYSQGVRGMFVRFTFPHARGKYIALCEGDDYWIDRYKLQKQVDFLEENLDFGLIHTNNYILHNTEGRIEKNPYSRDDGFIFKELLKGNQISTLTVVARRDVIVEAIKSGDVSISKFMGDYPLWLVISRNCKVKFLPETMGTYRKLDESAFNTKNEVKAFLLREEISRIQRFFAEKYDCLPDILEHLVNENRNHLHFAGVNYLPGSGEKAYTFLKKHHKMRAQDYLLYFFSQSKLIHWVIKILLPFYKKLT
jgi:glycosyltransferase involved in cell wall biosynthesis